MNEHLDINLKLENFKAMTENTDDGVALKYLEENDWDEGRAANQYLNDISRNSNIDHTSEIRRNQISEQRQPTGSQEGLGFFGGFMGHFSKFKNMFNQGLNFPSFTGGEFEDNNIYQPREQRKASPGNTVTTQPNAKNELLNFLPYTAKSLDEFHKTIKTKIGILFIYSAKDLDLIQHIFDTKLYNDPDLMMVVENEFVTFSLEDISKETQQLTSQLNLTFPCCLFLYNPFNLDKTDPNIVIQKLQGPQIENLSEGIYNCLSLKENINTGNQNLYQYEEEEDNTHGSIINKQKEELRRLEREEEDKKRKAKVEEEMKRQKQREEREREERKMLEEKQKEQLALMKKKQLPIEPPSDDVNSSHILFRFPDGINRSERRFRKTDKIKDLYNYVESLQDVDFNHEGKFELVQTFPFLIVANMEKTLEEEKLFPNAVIQIREKD